jgi:hypothetical protein
MPVPPPTILPQISPSTPSKKSYTNPHLDFEPLPKNHQQNPSQNTATPQRRSDGGVKETSPQGINAGQILHYMGQKREWNGIGHVFVSCLGVMGYGNPAEDVEGVEGFDLEVMQCELFPLPDLTTSPSYPFDPR